MAVSPTAAQLDAIEAAARKATGLDLDDLRIIQNCSKEDAEFVALLDPATVLWLVRRARDAEKFEKTWNEVSQKYEDLLAQLGGPA